MSTPIGSRSRTHSIRRESAASLPQSTTCSSDSTSPPRAVPTDGTVMWSGSDRTVIGNEVAVGDVSACSGDSCKKSGGDRSFASYASGTSYVDCSGIGAVAKRSCVEEEAFQRGRIYLQQLESWKNLRVQALQEQPGSLACSRSASLRSLSTATRQEVVLFSPPRRQRQQQLLSTSPQLQQEATSPQPQPQPQLSPPPSPAKQAQPQLARPQLQQQPKSQSQSQSQSQSPQLSQPQRPFNSRRPGDSEWGGAHLLEKYYEGEVRRVAQRGQRLQEREWRLMERQLQDARAAETRAVEEARATAERVRALEGQLHAAQQALAGVSASGREALEDLQLRDRQVEVLSIEVERLRMENMTIAVERRKVESLMKERVGELEAAAEASRQTEATLAARLQEAQYELSGHHQVLRERDEALCRESQSHQLVEERVAEMERQLKEATSLVDGERQEARRQAKRQAKALQQSQARCEELQRRYKEKERELTEQAERYEEILAARDASAASTTAQIEKEVDGYRRQYRELQQQLLQERVAMAAVAETQRAEVLRLRRTLNALQEELLLEAEDSRGSLAASRKHLQGELARGRHAEALLREASAEVARLRTTVADLQQKQHGSEGVLHDSPAQLSPKQKQTKKQRQKQRQRHDPPLPEDEPVPLPGDTTSLLLNECDDVNNDDRSTHHHDSYHCNGGGHNPQQFLFPCKKGDDGEERSPSVRNGTVPHAVDRPSSSLSRGEQENAQANGETAPSPEPSYTCTESATSDLVKCIEERLEPHLAALQTKVVDAVSALTSAGGYGVPEEQPQQPHDDKYQLTHLVNSPPTRRGTAPQVADAALTLGCVVKLLEAVSTLNVVLPYFESLSYQAAADGVLRGMDKRLVECLQQQQRLLRFAMQKIDEGRGQGGSPPASNVLSASNVAIGDPLIPALTVALEERLETLLAMADLSNWAGPSSDPATVSTHPQFEEAGNASVSAEPMALRQVTPSSRDEDHALQQLGPAQSPLSPPRRSRTGDVRSRHTFGAVGGRLEVSESGAGIRRLPLPSVVDIISCSALGALNHKSFSMDHRAAPASALSSCSPPCFTYTIRAVAPCTNLLVGLSDAQLPLEVFSPALNSLSYPNCYFLHLGRGTLYCPRLSMADVPYPSFMCSGPILVDEEVTCVLDVAARTIRFVRSGVDCGVAFNDVEVSLPLCPAFEFDSSGGAIEFSSLDHTATDALHNFQVALRRSQEALQQEEARFNQLTQAIHQQQEVNSTHREFIRGQQQPRLDALHREITRLRSLLDQQREEAGSQQSHLEAVRRPRREGEARDRELRRKIEGQRREYSRRAAAVQAALLQWWNPQNSLENLSAVAEQRVLEAEALRCQVAGLQTRLQDLTATVVGEANQNRNGAGTDSVEKESNTDNVAGKGGEASAEDQCDGEGCVESLRLRLRQQQDQREAFVRSSSENISFRRRELQSLKADLQKLCAAVETADAARQEVQQKLRGALNQQSNTRVVCCRCGLDVVGSFVA